MHFKTPILAGLLAASLLIVGCSEKPAPDFDARLQTILDMVEERFEGLPEGEIPDLSAELAALDALAIEEASTSVENASMALRRKASLQIHYIDDKPAGKNTLKELMARFPGSPAAAKAETMLASLQIQAGLVAGAWFPDFQAEDLQGGSLSVSQFKGKVVLVDFWATWCPPCREELPQVKAAYSAFHEKGFEIVGISLDSKRDTLDRFLEKEAMTWAQTCDLEGWDGQLVKKYGIMSIPSTYLLNRDGRIVATDLRGDDLETHLTKLLGAE